MSDINWPIGENPISEALDDADVLGLYKLTAVAPGKKQRRMTFLEFKEYMQLMAELIVTGQVTLNRDGGTVDIGDSTSGVESRINFRTTSGYAAYAMLLSRQALTNGNGELIMRGTGDFMFRAIDGARWVFEDTDVHILNPSPNLFLTDSDAGADISASGRVVFGRTVTPQIARIGLISSSDNALYLQTELASGEVITRSGVAVEASRVTNDQKILMGYTVSQGAYKLQVNGAAANTTGVWVNISDERFKENFRKISDPIQKVRDIEKAIFHYNFKDGFELPEGLRTQYRAQTLIENGFADHVMEGIPPTEEMGITLGWEYVDEKYKVSAPKKEIISDIKREIVDGKIVETPIKVEVKVTETITEQEIQEDFRIEKYTENGKGKERKIMLGTFSIVEVEKEIPVMEEITKTRRVVTKKGSPMLQVENNFDPYYGAAIAALADENDILKARIEKLEAK